MTVCAGRKFGKGPSGPCRAGAVTAEFFQGFLDIGAVLLFHIRQFPNHDQMASKGRMGLSNCMVSKNTILLCLLQGIVKRLCVCTRTMEYDKVV